MRLHFLAPAPGNDNFKVIAALGHNETFRVSRNVMVDGSDGARIDVPVDDPVVAVDRLQAQPLREREITDRSWYAEAHAVDDGSLRRDRHERIVANDGGRGKDKDASVSALRHSIPPAGLADSLRVQVPAPLQSLRPVPFGSRVPQLQFGRHP